MLLGLMAAVVFSGAKMSKALAMACLGILLGSVGTDVETGAARFTFGLPELSEGIGMVALSMGLFGLSEIIMNISKLDSREVMQALPAHVVVIDTSRLHVDKIRIYRHMCGRSMSTQLPT